ncbi:MAG: lysine--tRNA ligase [Candidatus Marsarchaeota archaeon]|jgi:lysyl-tRNA synthetase class 2|nr:lysine--tRNA ligase [Candidatus Marsarchaeota archaeon]
MENIKDEDLLQLKKFFMDLPYSFNANVHAKQIKDNYSEFDGKDISIAGRIIAIRKSGKLIFVDLLDESGKIQIYFDFNIIGSEQFEKIKSFNSGDIIGVVGTIFKTIPGEISVKAKEYKQLSKALSLLPDKWHGLQNTEVRYRKRYLDLIINPHVREIFRKRSMITKKIREFLDQRGFMEFETPVIQPLYGGADAEPFKTFVNTLNEEDYLRISNELYLKRLIIGGFEKVYEIYKAFRNEDIDVTHSPEFTMIEIYQAYVDYNDIMKLNEELFNFIAKDVLNMEEFDYQNKKISFKLPFKRLGFLEGINKKVGFDVSKLSDEELFKLAESKGIKFEKSKRNRAHAYNKLLEVLVQPELIQPTFIVDFPKETTALARPKRDNDMLVERYELYISGIEISNAYSELNNPIIQRENFEEEEKKAVEGDKEAEPLDNEFIEAMDYGMPPTGGIGIGIDRLVMLLTNQSSIKEVILFPMEKREVKLSKNNKDNKNNNK